MTLWHILLVSVLAGCAATQSNFLMSEDENGTMTPVLIVRGECPNAVSNAPDVAGCYRKGAVVWLAVDDGDTLEHELDHHKGLKHNHWQMVGYAKCAMVTASGRTKWIAGRLLCRGDRGYFQREAE